jgi:hypothetical protein
MSAAASLTTMLPERSPPAWIPAGDVTKIVAIVLMLVDHIGAIYAPQDLTWRIIGRAAYPLFACLLAAGMLRTRNRRAYLSRLVLFALVAQWPYHFFFVGTINIGATLTLSALALAACEAARARQASPLVAVAAVIGAAYAGYLLHVDFGWLGVLLPVAIAYLRSLTLGGLVVAAFLIVYGLWTHWLPSVLGPVTAVPALILLSHLDRQEPFRSWRVVPWWAFYAIYPLHLLVFALISGRIRL